MSTRIDYEDLLNRRYLQKYWFCESYGESAQLLELVSSLPVREVRAVAIDLTCMKSMRQVYDAFAVKLSFPEYFGRNYNAFIDCLFDLSWLSEKSAFVAVVGCSAFERKHPRIFNELRDAFRVSDWILLRYYLKKKLIVAMDRE
jgi:RNAse (barnase) inhibitor barstar